jgi:ribosomal protein L2
MLRLGSLQLLRGAQLAVKPTVVRPIGSVNPVVRSTLLSQFSAGSVRNFASKKNKVVKPVMQLTSSPLGVATDGASAEGALKKKAAPSAFPSTQFKTYKPTTPGKRWLKRVPRDHLYKGKAVRNLTVAKRSTGGRNNHGRITIRHRGGGHKRRIRIIDWHRAETGTQEVMRLEHDPGRSAWIALLRHEQTGSLSYIVAPHGLKAGDKVVSYRNSEEAKSTAPKESADGYDTITRTASIEKGNCMPLKMIPVGTIVHNIGLRRNGPGIIARAAGTYAQLIQTGEIGYAQIRLSSGEVRRVPVDVCATIGSVSNPDHQHEMLGKAGRSRWLGIRPTVRGVAQNATDHPHGGGRGKSKGNKDPRSPWGVLAKGGKTRKSPNPFVVKPRPRR